MFRPSGLGRDDHSHRHMNRSSQRDGFSSSLNRSREPQMPAGQSSMQSPSQRGRSLTNPKPQLSSYTGGTNYGSPHIPSLDGNGLKASHPEGLSTWPPKQGTPGKSFNTSISLDKSKRSTNRPVTSNSAASSSRTRPSSPGLSLSGTSGLPKVDERAEIWACRSVGGVAPGFVKENQDDSFLVKSKRNDEWFAGVMDGHGINGKKVSGFIKEKLVSDDVGHRVTKGDPSEAINYAYNLAQTELKRSGIDVRESGSTTVTCMRKGDELYVGNVGDSRCVLARKESNGDYKAVNLSRDHKPRRKDEMERILRCNGHVEPTRAFGGRFVGPARVWAVKQQVGGLAVSRAIGDTNLNSVGVIPNPEITREKISRDDKMVILASDGVWEHLSSQDVVNVAKQYPNDPKRASDAIVSKARDMWGKERCGYRDDITAVVVKLD